MHFMFSVCITQGFHYLKAVWSKAKLYFHQNSGELKVLTVFCYYSIFTIFLLASTTVRVIVNPEYIARLLDYFFCEATPGNICERGFGIFGANLLLNITFFLTGFYPIVSLVYVLNVHDVKQKFSGTRRNRATIHNRQGTVSRATTVQSLASVP